MDYSKKTKKELLAIIERYDWEVESLIEEVHDERNHSDRLMSKIYDLEDEISILEGKEKKARGESKWA